MENLRLCMDCKHQHGLLKEYPCFGCYGTEKELSPKPNWEASRKYMEKHPTAYPGPNLADIKEDYILPYQTPKFTPPPMPQCKPAKESDDELICRTCRHYGTMTCGTCTDHVDLEVWEDAPKSDPVAHPNHYCKGGMECIDAIRAAVTGLTGFEAYCTGNILKYIWRWHDKNGAEDLRKAKQYIDFLIEEVEK